MSRDFKTEAPFPDIDNLEEEARNWLNNLRSSSGDLNDEVVQARGGQNSLSDRLSEIGTGTGSGSQWEVIDNATRLSETTFSVIGADVTTDLINGTPIRVGINGDFQFGHVLSSALSGNDTTVTVDFVIDPGASGFAKSFITPELLPPVTAGVDESKFINIATGRRGALTPTEHKPGVMIPLYIYPGNIFTNTIFNSIIDAKRRYHSTPFIVIINPQSGPGSVIDGNYSAALERMQAAGIKVIGYVSTAYTNRLISDVKADIDTWINLYPRVDGIFFDEMTNDINQDHVDYYIELKDYVYLLERYLVVTNPGTPAPEIYFANDVADIILVHESSTLPRISNIKGDFDGGAADYPYWKRGGLVHSQTTFPWTAEDAGAGFAHIEIMRKHWGWIYITHDLMPNPWDEVSIYLEQTLAYLSKDESESLYQAPDRKIGINTFEPTTELDVAGTIQADLLQTNDLNVSQLLLVGNGSQGKIATGGETLPDCGPGGITLKSAEGEKILTLKTSDKTHSLTSAFEEDTFFTIHNFNGRNNGTSLTGVGTHNVGLVLSGVVESPEVEANVESHAPVQINGFKYSEGNLDAATGNELICGFSTGYVSKAFITASGDIKLDGNTLSNSFDSEDDLALCRVLQKEISTDEDKKTPDGWEAEVFEKHRERLEDLGILDNGFLSLKKAHALELGALHQLHQQLQQLIEGLSKHLGIQSDELLQLTNK